MAVFLWPAAVFGQSPELMDAYNRVNELRAEGRYQEAIPLAMKALRLSEREFGPDHPNTGGTLNYLAGLYREQGRYGDAEPLDKRAPVVDRLVTAVTILSRMGIFERGPKENLK